MHAALSKPRIIGRWLVAALLLVGLAACGTPRLPGASASAPAPEGRAATPAEPGGTPLNGPVRLALLVPLSADSGGAAQLAGALARAAELGLADLANPRLALEIYDTGGRAQQAVAAAERAVAEGADILLGPLFGANARAVAPVASRAGLKVLAFSTDSTVAGGPVYISGYTPEAEALRILGYARSRGIGRIGVFAPDTDYGAASLRGALEADDRGIVRIDPVVRYRVAVQAIEEAARQFAVDASRAPMDGVLLPAGGQELQAAAGSLSVNGVNGREFAYLGLGKWFSRATFREPALVGGLFVAPDPERVERFSARFRARYGTDAPPIATLGYDAVQIVGQLLRDARGGSAFGHAALTRPQGFSGALGPVRFRPDGTAERGMAVVEVARSGFITRDPAPFSFAAGS